MTTTAAHRLDEHLRRAAARVRRRRVVTVLWWGGILLVAAGALVATWGQVGPAVGLAADPGVALAPLRTGILLALGVVVLGAWRRGVADAGLAREIDRRLRLRDGISSALAVARGDVRAGLGALLVEDAAVTLDAHAPALAAAFPALPSRRSRAALVATTWIVAFWTLAIVMSALVGSRGGDGFRLPGWSGGPSADRPGDAHVAGAPDGDDPRRGPHTPDGDAPPDGRAPTDEGEPSDDPAPPDAPPSPEDPGPQPSQPEPPQGPLATAEVVPSAEVFDPGDPILVLAVSRPGAGLAAPREMEVVAEIDGREVVTGERVTLTPDAPRGDVRSIRLGRLPAPPELLGPGEHEVRVILRPGDGAPDVRSEPRSFSIRGGEPRPQPPPTQPPPTQPPPTQAPPAQPPPPQETPPGPDGAPPPDPTLPDPTLPDPTLPDPTLPDPEPAPPDLEAPVPEPTATERKVVVPLVDDGETIRKDGPRAVLVPGAGGSSTPRVATPEEALEILRRAESALDAARVRESDRALVRRYFERLRRALGEDAK